MGSFSYTLKCKLQPLNCLTLIGTEGLASNSVHSGAFQPLNSGHQFICSMAHYTQELRLKGRGKPLRTRGEPHEASERVNDFETVAFGL